MFYGMCNSPSTFQAIMDDMFKDLIALGVVVVYLDDILIFTNDLKEHRRIVREVLRRLRKHDFYLKHEKCEFEKEQIEYLGLLISHGKVEMDPVKVEAILQWPTPTNASEVRKFRGFANFYRRFIEVFSKIAKPLDRLTGNEPWKWGSEQQSAFEELKTRFSTYPVLRTYDPERETQVEVDASGYATGGVLSQKQDDGKWHPIAFLSQSMTEAERNYEIYDKELLAIVRALETWRH